VKKKAKDSDVEYGKLILEHPEIHERNLERARELLKEAGYVQGPGDAWTPAKMGKSGGKARAAKLSKRELTAIGKKGAATRWAKKPAKKGGKP
jgi:ABC-type transport system substrate-binding protein